MWTSCVISLRLNDCGNTAGQKPQTTGIERHDTSISCKQNNEKRAGNMQTGVGIAKPVSDRIKQKAGKEAQQGKCLLYQDTVVQISVPIKTQECMAVCF